MADPTPAPTGTQTMIATLGATVAKNLLMTAGTALAAHGILSSGSGIEIFVSVGMALAGAGWSFWNSYGRAILMSKLEVWKAKSEAQAAAMRKANVPPVTNAQIADKIPDPAVTADVVAKATAAVLALMIVFAVSPALAQDSGVLRGKSGASSGIKLPIDPLGLNSRAGSASGNPLLDIIGAFDAKLEPDLTVALAMATNTKNDLTAKCWSVWLDQIHARQNAMKDAQGNPIAMPDPHILTDFERIMEIRAALDPSGAFSQACLPIALRIQMDIQQMLGAVASGGILGLAKFTIPGL